MRAGVLVSDEPVFWMSFEANRRLMRASIQGPPSHARDWLQGGLYGVRRDAVGDRNEGSKAVPCEGMRGRAVCSSRSARGRCPGGTIAVR